MRLIDADELCKVCREHGSKCMEEACEIPYMPIVDAVPVADIKAYLRARFDGWNALGERKFEPANMWGYNFIMACFDDLERRTDDA